ncbi:MAG: AmmeMemoRadiSam system radical SAM enzyme [Bacteroidales bacterium]|nr:AmmeMemoRadiSam system radical SAM enzyme [Bacteroidales bacterium]
MEARFYTPTRDDAILCELCPHRCLIFPGKTGKCRVRTNRAGKLYADTYQQLAATHFDPIEKKPLYHFYPGSEIFSIGSLGCNFRCGCCQNHEISQTGVAGFPGLQELTVDQVVGMASTKSANIGIAYTYNEPFVWYEYMFDIAVEAKDRGLKNVAVSNGYINEEPLKKLLPFMDAFNIDLKAFSARAYKSFTNGELHYVMNALSLICQAGCHLEITMLVVPGINDDLDAFRRMTEWIAERLGTSVPLHLSRYFPRYNYQEPPTAMSLLTRMAELASERLDYVYLGNAPGVEFQDTRCPQCGALVISRQGYYISRKEIDRQGQCSNCGHKIVISE